MACHLDGGRSNLAQLSFLGDHFDTCNTHDFSSIPPVFLPPSPPPEWGADIIRRKPPIPRYGEPLSKVRHMFTVQISPVVPPTPPMANMANMTYS